MIVMKTLKDVIFVDGCLDQDICAQLVTMTNYGYVKIALPLTTTTDYILRVRTESDDTKCDKKSFKEL